MDKQYVWNVTTEHCADCEITRKTKVFKNKGDALNYFYTNVINLRTTYDSSALDTYDESPEKHISENNTGWCEIYNEGWYDQEHDSVFIEKKEVL